MKSVFIWAVVAVVCLVLMPFVGLGPGFAVALQANRDFVELPMDEPECRPKSGWPEQAMIYATETSLYTLSKTEIRERLVVSASDGSPITLKSYESMTMSNSHGSYVSVAKMDLSGVADHVDVCIDATAMRDMFSAGNIAVGRRVAASLFVAILGGCAMSVICIAGCVGATIRAVILVTRMADKQQAAV